MGTSPTAMDITVQYLLISDGLKLVESKGYKNNANFSDYNRSVNVHITTNQAISHSKFTYFFCCIEESLLKHVSI